MAQELPKAKAIEEVDCTAAPGFSYALYLPSVYTTEKTWPPHALNVFLAWVILFAEPLLSLWILSGIKQRLAWTLTSIFMFQLVAGQSLLMKPDVIYNWHYLILTVACAALSEPLRQRSE